LAFLRISTFTYSPAPTFLRAGKLKVRLVVESVATTERRVADAEYPERIGPRYASCPFTLAGAPDTVYRPPSVALPKPADTVRLKSSRASVAPLA
jgi:hypothetical protein